MKNIAKQTQRNLMNRNENEQNHVFETFYLRNRLVVPKTDCRFKFSSYELATVGKISIVPFLTQKLLSPGNGPMKYFCISLLYPPTCFLS